MNKILIEFKVPVLGMSFDAFVPMHISAYEMLEMIKKAVNETAEGGLILDESTTLCRNDGKILNINLSVSELGIRNGSKLMLI